VAAVVQGVWFLYVTVVPEDDLEGHVRWRRLRSDPLTIHKRGVTRFAGQVAQELRIRYPIANTGSDFTPIWRDGSHGAKYDSSRRETSQRNCIPSRG
jgi:hypothetical protein